MAGVSTKEIKTRIRSMESTKQITKAMEMVASSKLRHAQNRVQNSRPYFQILWQTIGNIAGASEDFSSDYLTQRPVKNAAFVVIAGDRGLAGGYNANVLKLAAQAMEGKPSAIVPVGKKAADYYKVHQGNILTQQYTQAGTMNMGDCFSLAKHLCKAYLSEEFDEVYVCYTNFNSVLSQEPQMKKLLPLQPSENGRKSASQDMIYEPDSKSVFDAVVPEYVGGVLYGALCESRAAEQAARRTAMDAATQNADEMISQLSLKYNQARQAAITQEITEIVAGS